MKFLIIQIILNWIIVRFVDEKYLKVYKRLSYLFYPALLTVLVMLEDNDVIVNKQTWSIVGDITFLSKWNYYIMVLLSVIIQIVFNTQYSKLLKKNNA
jgi:hypothetical protein